MTEENNEYYLDTPEDVYGALRKIVLMKRPVSVVIEGSDESFSSAITHTSLKNSSFYMDKVVPQKGNELIRAGHRFGIVADSQGIKIEFKMTGRLKYQPDKEQYRGEFPEQVLYLQRRTAYRVMLPPAHEILVMLKLGDDEKLMGRLADISSSGFKAHFKGDHKAKLEQHKDIPIARLKFNEQHNMDCSLEARHIVNTKDGDTQVGFAFSMISGMGQRYLDRLIGELQWEERHRAEQQQQKAEKAQQDLPQI